MFLITLRSHTRSCRSFLAGTRSPSWSLSTKSSSTLERVTTSALDLQSYTPRVQPCIYVVGIHLWDPSTRRLFASTSAVPTLEVRTSRRRAQITTSSRRAWPVPPWLTFSRVSKLRDAVALSGGHVGGWMTTVPDGAGPGEGEPWRLFALSSPRVELPRQPGGGVPLTGSCLHAARGVSTNSNWEARRYPQTL